MYIKILHFTIFNFNFQIQLEAFDDTYPQNKEIEYITITVNRNAHSPAFSATAYTKTVSDSFPLVTELLQLSARDEDGDVLSYSLVDHSNNGALDYFFIDEAVGTVMLKKPLSDGAATTFQVIKKQRMV